MSVDRLIADANHVLGTVNYVRPPEQDLIRDMAAMLGQARDLVAEFGEDLSVGSGFGESTLVDTATLRALYDLMWQTEEAED